MNNPGEQVALGARVLSVSPAARRYIGECARLLEAALSPLTGALFDKVDDALYDLADKSVSNGLYTVYYDGMRIIRKKRHGIQLNFSRLIREVADRAASGVLVEHGESLVPDYGSLDYGLVPEAELEESLAIDNLVSKADSRYRRDLMEMNHHLAALLNREQLDGRCNPFGPAALCEAFRGALDTAPELEPQIRLVLYKLFDKNVTDRLGEFYADCVKLALAGGHTSGAGFAHLVRRSADGARTSGAASEASTRGRGPAASLPETLSLPFETLQELLGRQRPRGPEPAGQNRVVLDTSELLTVLNNIGAVAVRKGAPSPTSLRASLSSVLGLQKGEVRALNRNDEDTLDLVFMFFEHLLQGNALPDPIKALIGRLQIPIAKLALLDKGFFSDPEHPARQLLNHMGEAAVGWSDDDRGPDGLYGMIERVVDRLILDFDGEPGLFAQLDRYFVAYIAREQARARAAEADSVGDLATQVPDSEQRAVAAALDACLARYPQVPAAVEAILREGWRPAMLVAYQSGRREGGAWQAGLALAERLLWSVQPKADAEERRQLLRSIPELLRSMRTQLVVGGCDQRQLARWFKELQTLHLGVLQADGGGASPAAGPSPPALAPALTAPPSLTLGSWVELRQNDGTTSRLKVAWVSPDGADYVLVDRRGARGPDLTRRQLWVLLEEGRAALLGERREPIADRALRTVARRLAPRDGERATSTAPREGAGSGFGRRPSRH